MTERPVIVVAVAAAALLVFAVWKLGAPRDATRAAAERSTSAPATPGMVVSRPVSTPATPARVQSVSSVLADFLTRLQKTEDAATCRALLAELRKRLDALPPAEAAREIQSFLALHQDAATKLDLTIQKGGALGDASSLRVFLLDYLGRVDRTAAAALGRQILGAPTSPDEWAISLRNVAWAGELPADLAYLRSKAREMISNPAWQANPSAGFLEAFDVIVHARGFELEPQLARMVADHENRALAHAAYLTMDRLTIADPMAALEPLAAQPQLMAGRELTRANLFARGDVRDPRQKALLEGYLLAPERSPEELRTFAGLFPNANYMISNNLLTTVQTPGREELAARDRASLETVESWMEDPRFAPLRPALVITRDRLRMFVQQEAR